MNSEKFFSVLTPEERKDLADRIKNLKDRHDKIDRKREKKESSRSAYSSALKFTHLGLEFALIFTGFIYLGHLADEKLQTSPLIFLISVGAGFAVAMYRVIHAANELSESDRD